MYTAHRPVTLWTWHQVDGHRTAHSTGLMCTEHAHRVRCTRSPCGHCVNTAHTVVVWPRHGTVAVWSQYTDTVTTQCVLLPCGYGTPIQCPHVWLPCGHGIPTPCQHRGYSCRAATVREHCAHLVQIPWPHGDRTPRGGTVAVYRVHMAIVHTVWPWCALRRPYPTCGTVSVYRVHTAIVHTVWPWCACTVATRRPYMVSGIDTVRPPWLRLPCGHGTWTPCPLGIDTMATRRPYTTWWHGGHVPCPHSNCTYRVATVWVYRGHTATVHIVWARTSCQHRAYGCRVATVHGHRAHLV